LLPLNTMRRLIAALAIVVLLALGITLLWRVYLHHMQTAHDESVLTL
jgi:MFS-type transporter involved in bile tolerance (Atg22 family)